MEKENMPNEFESFEEELISNEMVQDDAVVDEEQPLAIDQFVHRDHFHLRHPVAFLLVRGHEAARPGRGVLDEGAGKGNVALVGIANGVGRA